MAYQLCVILNVWVRKCVELNKMNQSQPSSYLAVCSVFYFIFGQCFCACETFVYYGLIRVYAFNCTANCVIQSTVFFFTLLASLRCVYIHIIHTFNLYDGIFFYFYFLLVYLKFRYFIYTNIRFSLTPSRISLFHIAAYLCQSTN